MQAPQATLDLTQDKQVGARLKSAREALNLPSSKVANILLLSRHQIESLEIGDISVFYNAQFYVQAADKYAAFLELTPAPSETLVAQPVTQEVAPVEAPTVDARVRPTKQVIAAAVVIALAAGVYLQWDQISNVINANLPSVPEKVTPKPEAKPVAEIAPVAPTAAQLAPVAETPALAQGSIAIHFTGSSWVQVVSADGTKQEHTYKAGETLTVEPAKLQALIIGNVEVATAESAKGPVSLKAYASAGSKVARIIGPAARALGAPSQTNRISGNH